MQHPLSLTYEFFEKNAAATAAVSLAHLHRDQDAARNGVSTRQTHQLPRPGHNGPLWPPPSPQEAVESLQRMVAGLGIRRGLTAGSSDFPTRPCRRRRHRNDAEAEVRCDDGFSCTSTRLPLPYRKRSGVNKSGELCSCRGIAPGLGGPASPLRPMPPSSRPRLFLAQPGSLLNGVIVGNTQVHWSGSERLS